MALERGDVWWLPALYLQKSELERGGRSAKRDCVERALDAGRAHDSGQPTRLEQWRILRAGRRGPRTLSRTLSERSAS